MTIVNKYGEIKITVLSDGVLKQYCVQEVKNYTKNETNIWLCFKFVCIALGTPASAESYEMVYYQYTKLLNGDASSYSSLTYMIPGYNHEIKKLGLRNCSLKI